MTEFTLHTQESAPESAKELLKGVQDSFNFLPILFRHMAEAPVVLQSLLTIMELVSKTSLTKAQQQVIALAASVENDCANCIAGHCVLGKNEKANEQTLNALLSRGGIDDPKDRILADFTRSVVKNRGRQPEKDVEIFLAEGFTKQHVFEVILIVAYKTLTNYSNHLTDSPVDEEMLAML